MEIKSSPGNTEADAQGKHSSPARRIFAWADAAFFVGFAVIVASRARWNLRGWIGLALATAGFALWMEARRQLGTSFSVKARARALVTTGLYSRFRHPVYVFGFVAICGVLLIWGSWIAFFCFLAVSSVNLVRARKEERVLEQAFGEEYRRYKRNTWM